MKEKKFPEHNYKSIFFNNKTLRFKLDQSKPMTELKYPEFYDVKITNKCLGRCPECYMNSTCDSDHADNIIEKLFDYFGPMNENERPYQIAIGGGEPTLHPQFIKFLQACKALGIVPNYTTNGMWSNPQIGWNTDEDTKKIKELLVVTKEYCGGVAVSAHEHLDRYWTKATWLYVRNGIRTNLHIVISDKASIDRFIKIFKKYSELTIENGKGIDYYVLLPYEAMGRAEPREIEYDYLFNQLRMLNDVSKISYGANFYESLKDQPWLDVSLYEPEAFSKYLDMSNMKLYKSSFNLVEVVNENENC
jgi:organic radical activating enzyme